MNSLYKKYIMLKIVTVYSNEKNEEYELDYLRIFNENGIILSTDAFISDNVENVNFEGKILLKRKEDFTTKDNYVVKNKWGKYDLYIYEKNIDWKYIELEKSGFYLYKIYEICGEKARIFVKNLGDNLYVYQTKIEDIAKDIELHLTLDFYNEEELNKKLNDIKKYNKLGLQELEKIKNYIPNENDL